MPVKKKPCTIDGVHYESVSAAAKALGTYAGVLLNRLGSSNFPTYISKHHLKVKRKKRIIPISCTIKGVEYRSVSYAAKKLEMSHALIFKRLASFNFSDYVSADVPKVAKSIKPPGYEVNGKKYHTLQEIGDAEGFTGERIRQKIKKPEVFGLSETLKDYVWH